MLYIFLPSTLFTTEKTLYLDHQSLSCEFLTYSMTKKNTLFGNPVYLEIKRGSQNIGSFYWDLRVVWYGFVCTVTQIWKYAFCLFTFMIEDSMEKSKVSNAKSMYKASWIGTIEIDFITVLVVSYATCLCFAMVVAILKALSPRFHKWLL